MACYLSAPPTQTVRYLKVRVMLNESMNFQGLAQIVCKINICQMNEWINMEDTDLRGWTALKMIRFWKDINTSPDGRPIICLDIWGVWSICWISEVGGSTSAFPEPFLSVPILGTVIGWKDPEVTTYSTLIALSLECPRPQQRGGSMWYRNIQSWASSGLCCTFVCSLVPKAAP